MLLNDPRELLSMIERKYRKGAEMARLLPFIPYRSDGKEWIGPASDGFSWWTGGFWPAIMWQLYSFTGDRFYLEEARRTQKLLTSEFAVYETLNHDMGFMYLLSCGADHKLTGDHDAFRDTMHAAALLMSRYNPTGFIRAWNEKDRIGWAIVDCMMNMPILWWAAEQTGDPRFAKVATAQTETTLRDFMREDGSFRHIVEFDPDTGKMLRVPDGQGYSPDSSWSRGQSWGLYGFTLAYMHTKNERYLHAAEKAAAYFTAHIRSDGITDCDFCQPEQPERVDNIAGAVAACAYLELAGITGKQDYRQTAMKLLEGLLLCCDWSEERAGILTRCTASYHDDSAGFHTNIIYGDYFFTEAVAKLVGTDPMLWMGAEK